MRQHKFAVLAILVLLVISPTSTLAGFVTFVGLNRSTVISPAGQTFTWTSDGQTGTVTVRPVGSTAFLNPTVPNTNNGRGPFSIFHTGVRSSGGPVDVTFEMLFSRPLDITVYNTESLAGREMMTLYSNGGQWTGGWYTTTTGNLDGLGTRILEMSTSGPTPPFPYAAVSSKGVTRLAYTNALLIGASQTGSIGNGIEIQIDAVAIPEPVSINLAAMGLVLLANSRFRQKRRPRNTACPGG